MKSISIIGSGGMTRSSINLLKSRFPDEKMYIFDESYSDNFKENIHDIKLIGNLDSVKSDDPVFLSMGDNLKRSNYFSLFKQLVIKENLFHQSSLVEKNCNFGVANQIYAYVYINSYCKIGDNNVINTKSVIEHEVILGSHNYVSIGALIAGRVTIGSNCYIGAGSVILENIRICDNVTVGAGSVVTKNIDYPGSYVGIPARMVV